MSARLLPTPSQTVGPFFEFGLLRPPQPNLVSPETLDSLRIEGTVFDGEDRPVPDAMLEIWQAAPSGRYAHPEDFRSDLPIDERFSGFGRNGTDAAGMYWFRTVKPGIVPWIDGRPQAPHLNVSIFARGLVHRLVTRMYFPDEPEANTADPVLTSVHDLRARATLIAVAGDGVLRFDLHLQGAGETCFFQI